MQPKLADSIIIVAGCLTSPGRVRVGFRVAEVCVCLVLRASCLTAIIGRSRTIYTVYILYTYKIHRRCMYTYNVCGKNHIYTVYILYCWSLTTSAYSLLIVNIASVPAPPSRLEPYCAVSADEPYVLLLSSHVSQTPDIQVQLGDEAELTFLDRELFTVPRNYPVCKCPFISQG